MAQRAQYGLVKEYTLHQSYIALRIPIFFKVYSLIKLGSLGGWQLASKRQTAAALAGLQLGGYL